MLIIDSKEPDCIIKLVQEYFKLYTETKVESLPVGDFLYKVENKLICFERKSYSDFVSSLQSGHLIKQMIQMEQYENSYLLISEYPMFNDAWTANHHTGAIASLSVRFPKIKILHLNTDKSLIYAMRAIIEKTDDGKEVTIKDTELLRKQLTPEHLHMRLLTSFSGIGLIKAEKYLQNKEVNKEIERFIEKMRELKVIKNV